MNWGPKTVLLTYTHPNSFFGSLKVEMKGKHTPIVSIEELCSQFHLNEQRKHSSAQSCCHQEEFRTLMSASQDCWKRRRKKKKKKSDSDSKYVCEQDRRLTSDLLQCLITSDMKEEKDLTHIRKTATPTAAHICKHQRV